jgi:hypothetical protein
MIAKTHHCDYCIIETQYKAMKLLRATIKKTQRLDQAVEKIFNVGTLAELSKLFFRLLFKNTLLSQTSMMHSSLSGFFIVVGTISLAVVGKS